MQPHSQLSDADRAENQAMVGMYQKQPVGWGGRLAVPDFQYEGSYQWNLKNLHTAQGLIQGSCEWVTPASMPDMRPPNHVDPLSDGGFSRSPYRPGDDTFAPAVVGPAQGLHQQSFPW